MTTRYCLLLFGALLTAQVADTKAHENPGTAKDSLRKVQTNDQYNWFTINNLFNWYGNNGNSSYNIATANSGLEYPKGTDKAAIFEDGILWGGFHKGRAEPKVGGSAYRYGLQAGELTGFGGPTEITRPPAADPTLPKYRVYKVRPDVTPRTSFADVKASMEEESKLINRYSPKTASALFAEYQQDWLEWPAKDGFPAPYKDVDGNGAFDPMIDIPGQPGADQTLYYVANDCNATRTTNLYFSPPIGLELHKCVWGYRRIGPLDQVIFASTLIINKSGASVDSMFLTQWSDPDLGENGDDLAGCDIGRRLGYVYNSKDVDNIYATEVPAVGYVLCQGAMIASPGDAAEIRNHLRPGYRNLGMTSFVFFTGGGAIYTDPPQAVPGGDVQMYRLMNGYIGNSGSPFVDPTTGQPTKFCLSGDPITNAGWVDGPPAMYPGDRRIMLNSGPFTMANGDTQEVVTATIVGNGADRLSSVNVLKYYADQAMQTYRHFFAVPLTPPAPRVTVCELDRQIVLTWSDSVGPVSIEKWNSGGQTFQGYNVFQYDGPPENRTKTLRLATYDLPDHVTYIFDDVYSSQSGFFIRDVVQYGRDSGIRRYYVATDDAINLKPLYNGTPYYFGVTSYTFDRDSSAKPSQMESASQPIAATPQWPQGIRYIGNIGDTLKNVSHSGPGSGKVSAKIIDPSSLPRNGGLYHVVFSGSFSDPLWHLVRSIDGRSDTLARNQRGFGATDDQAVIADGVDWRVTNPLPGFPQFYTTANASGPIIPPQQAAFAFNASGFPLTPDGSDRPGTGQQSAGKLTASQGWGIHVGMNSLTMTLSFSNFVSRVTKGSTLWSSIIPSDYEIRFRSSGAKALIASALGSKNDRFIDAPFELWNIGTGTPNDPSDDFRLFPYLLDVDNSRSFALLTKPGTDSIDLGGGGPTHSISGGANDPFSDWFTWVAPFDKTPGDAGYRAILAAAQDSVANGRNPYLGGGAENVIVSDMVLVGWNMGPVATGPGSYRMQMPEPGTTFRILTTKPFSSDDVFTFTIPPADQSDAVQKADADRVNVFPNPFIGNRNLKTGRIADQYVTFTHLPRRAIIRIYTLAGHLLRSFNKDDSSQFLNWDLTNKEGWLVGPAMYIVRIEMPDAGVVKVLKLAIITADPVVTYW